MNRSMNTPPTFIAMPWTPVGSPNRNSDRMIVRSGFRSMPRSKWMTDPGRVRYHMPYSETLVLLAIGTYRRANRPESRDEDDVEEDGQQGHGQTQVQRRARIARGAERAAQHEEHHHAGDADEHHAQERQRFGRHLGRGIHQLQQGRGGDVSHRRQGRPHE